MNLLDLILLFGLLGFIGVGFRNGVIREIASFLGILIVFFISYLLKGFVGNFLCSFFPFFSFEGVLEGLTTINILFYQMIAFLFLFILLLSLYHILLKISKVLQKLVNMTIILWLPSKLLGMIVGALKGYFVMLLFLLVLLIPLQKEEFFQNSKVASFLLYDVPFVSSYTEQFTSSVLEIYELGEEVKNKNISTNEANVKTLDLLLKYHMVSKSTVEKLIASHKLDPISDYESVLEKY